MKLVFFVSKWTNALFFSLFVCDSLTICDKVRYPPQNYVGIAIIWNIFFLLFQRNPIVFMFYFFKHFPSKTKDSKFICQLSFEHSFHIKHETNHMKQRIKEKKLSFLWTWNLKNALEFSLTLFIHMIVQQKQNWWNCVPLWIWSMMSIVFTIRCSSVDDQCSHSKTIFYRVPNANEYSDGIIELFVIYSLHFSFVLLMKWKIFVASNTI